MHSRGTGGRFHRNTQSNATVRLPSPLSGEGRGDEVASVGDILPVLSTALYLWETGPRAYASQEAGFPSGAVQRRGGG